MSGQASPQAMPNRLPTQGSGKGGAVTQFRNADNVFDKASAGFDGAMIGAGHAMGYQPLSVQGGGYNPALVDPSGYSADRLGYNAATAQANTGNLAYNPMDVAARSYDPSLLRGADLSGYMNPYEDQVVNQSLADIDRARQMQSNFTDDQLKARGAFGGSRTAIAQAENNRNFLDQSARTASQLRLQGFNNAQNMALADAGAQNAASQFNVGNDLRAQLANQGAQQAMEQFSRGTAANLGTQVSLANQGAANDALRFGRTSALEATLRSNLANQSAQNAAARYGADQSFRADLANQGADMNGAQFRFNAANAMGNLANMGFGFGNAANAALANAGANRRAIDQGILSGGMQQFSNFTNAPQNSLSLFQQALSGTPYSQTIGRNPGLFDYLTLGASLF